MDKSRLEDLIKARGKDFFAIIEAISNFSRDYSGRKSVGKVWVRQNRT
jgi:hypothetical protein